MIHPIVPITPSQSTFVSREIAVMRRYSKNAVSAQTPTARRVAGIKNHVNCRVPITGRFNFPVRVDQICSSRGQKNAAYCDKPIAPEASDRGALNESCQINKKEMSRPSFCGPYI